MFHVTGYQSHIVVMHLVHTESGTVFMFVFYHIEEAELLHALTKHSCMTLKGGGLGFFGGAH